MRIFFDTSVLASALMGHGLCRDLLDRAVIGHSVLLGAPVLEELHRVLAAKFRVPADLCRELESRLSELEQTPAATVPLGLAVPDPTDVPILACAVSAKKSKAFPSFPFGSFGKSSRVSMSRTRRSSRELRRY